ncbi:MAG: CRISPR-associated endonuclease Cas1 [Treponemataceae bacterium]
MSDIYILTELGKLGRSDDALVFYTPEGERTILPTFKINQLVLIGKISISGDAIRLLSRHKIPVAFISHNGFFNTRFTYSTEKNVLLRQKQYRLLDDEKGTLKIAKAIVCGKIKNQISYMQRIKRKRKCEDAKIHKSITRVKNLLEDAERADNIDSLRGFEGMTSKHYFDVIKYNIQPEWAEFPCRSKNPPKSNVNSVLSFLYTVLTTHIICAIEASALDPMVGTLHSVIYGANALAFDLTEEFRTPIADTICCSLFNLGILKPDNFEEKTLQDSTGIFLNKDGIQKVLKAFQDKLNSNISIATKKDFKYRDIFFEQVEKYKKMLNGDIAEYTPYYFK